MKFIYDEKEAKIKKENFDKQIEESKKETSKKNKRSKTIIRSVVWSIVFILLAALWILFAWYRGVEEDPISVIACTGFTAIIALLGIVATTSWEDAWKECPLNNAIYTSDVRYFLCVKDKTVLKQEFKVVNEGFIDVHVDLECQNGNVYTDKACTVKRVISTKVTEETADLLNGIYFVPYDGTNAEQQET